MRKTYVLTSTYDNETVVLAAGDDLEKLRKLLRSDARTLVRGSEYNTASRKELRAEILAELKRPDIMHWDDGETEDLYSLDIHERVPFYDTAAATARDYTRKTIDFIRRELRKAGYAVAALTDPDEPIYEDLDILGEGIRVRHDGLFPEILRVEVSLSGVTVVLVTWGESDTGSDDYEETVPFSALSVNAQKTVYKYIRDNFDTKKSL